MFIYIDIITQVIFILILMTPGILNRVSSSTSATTMDPFIMSQSIIRLCIIIPHRSMHAIHQSIIRPIGILFTILFIIRYHTTTDIQDPDMPIHQNR